MKLLQKLSFIFSSIQKQLNHKKMDYNYYAKKLKVSPNTIRNWASKGIDITSITFKKYGCRACQAFWERRRLDEAKRCPLCKSIKIFEVKDNENPVEKMEQAPISYAEAGRFLGVSPNTVRKWQGESALATPLNWDDLRRCKSHFSHWMCYECGAVQFRKSWKHPTRCKRYPHCKARKFRRLHS